MIVDWNKLRHEWKTFAWGIISLVLESWDTVLSYQLSLVDPILPEDKQWILHIAVPVGFFALRKWKDARAPDEPADDAPVVPSGKAQE